MRPEISGHLADGAVRFNLEPNFTENDVSLEEAWIGADLGNGAALLMAGRMKVPFGLEEVRSRRHIDFPFFSALNQFSPAEGHGLFMNGHTGQLEWGLSATRGTGLLDSDIARDLAARVMWHSPGHSLQLGIAATWGDADIPLGGASIANAAGLPVIAYVSGVSQDGRRSRAGLEAAWFHGPWMAQAEVLGIRQILTDAAASDDVDVRGAYLTLSLALTGEDKTFDGVVPADPFDFATREGSGAWVAAVRVSGLDLGDGLAAFADPYRDSLLGLSVGLNWIANAHVTWRNAVVFADYADPEKNSSIDPFDRDCSFLMELQLHF